MSEEYNDDFISNLRGKFQGDREATIKHLIDTGHTEEEAGGVADFIQGQIQEDEDAHESNLEEDRITAYKERFGVLSNEARGAAFMKAPTNNKKVLENLNELIDLIPTVPARKHPGLNLIWLSTIGVLIKEDEFNNYATELITTANSYIKVLKQAQERKKTA